VWIIENGYDKWIWAVHEEKFRLQLADKDDETMDQEKFDKLQKAGTDDKYTTSSGGQQQYGGLTDEGKARMKELEKAIRKNRNENADLVKEVEDKVLVMVRKKNGRDEIDEKRKRKGNKKKARVVDEESDVDENDMENW
jgi:hypothetical protein